MDEQIKDKLKGLVIQVADMKDEAYQIIYGLEDYHEQSAAAQIVDRLDQVTAAVMDVLDPSRKDRQKDGYRVEEDEDGYITAWHRQTGYGFKFKQGDIMARYTFTAILPKHRKQGEEGRRELEEMAGNFLQYATAAFPDEFKDE